MRDVHLLVASSALVLGVSACGSKVTLIEAVGDVRQDGAALAANDEVAVTSEITVGQGRAVIKLADGTIIRIYPQTRCSVDPTLLKVKLAVGKLWAKVTGLSGGERFAIETENAVAGVRGTEFSVNSRDGTSEVRVLEGEVDVQSLAHPEDVRTLHKGEASRVRRDAAPSRAEPFDVDDETSAWDELASLLRRAANRAANKIEQGANKARNKLKSLFK